MNYFYDWSIISRFSGRFAFHLYNVEVQNKIWFYYVNVKRSKDNQKI